MWAHTKDRKPQIVHKEVSQFEVTVIMLVGVEEKHETQSIR
jgi:hypothetical protein